MMKKMYVLSMVVAFMLTAGITSAQEWSKDQTEVWKVVQDSWKGWQTGDATAVFATVHEKYQGWSDDMPLPIGKQSMMDWYNSMKGSMKFNYYNIEPARILVMKSVAVVDYYYYFNVSWTMGNESKTEDVKGKVAEFYINESGTWQLIGDMMVHEGDEDDD